MKQAPPPRRDRERKRGGFRQNGFSARRGHVPQGCGGETHPHGRAIGCGESDGPVLLGAARVDQGKGGAVAADDDNMGEKTISPRQPETETDPGSPSEPKISRSNSCRSTGGVRQSVLGPAWPAAPGAEIRMAAERDSMTFRARREIILHSSPRGFLLEPVPVSQDHRDLVKFRLSGNDILALMATMANLSYGPAARIAIHARKCVNSVSDPTP